MYRGTPYINRQIKKKQEQRSMQYHINNLSHIRPRTSTIQYGGEIHINNKKRQMQKQARFTQIQRQNRILLEKISSIMGKPQTKKAQSLQKINRSLNSQFRKRQMQNIQVQNAKLLKRLQQRKPNYEAQKFKQSWRKQKYVIKNLSNYPFIINDRKRKRSSASHIGGKQPKSNTVQLCRMRIIDGVSFLVTVRLNHQRLQIIGDTKDKKQIKVIQIERNQALQFIEQQCGGKIQKIFDCLRFDKVDEVMYLVANETSPDEITGGGESLKIKNGTRRQQNPEFDISLDPQNDYQNDKDNDLIPGQIPIHVSNGHDSKKYWVEVQKKPSQKLNQKEDYTKNKVQKKEVKQKIENPYQQFIQQSNKSYTKKQTPKKQQNNQQKKQQKFGINKKTENISKTQQAQFDIPKVPQIQKITEKQKKVKLQKGNNSQKNHDQINKYTVQNHESLEPLPLQNKSNAKISNQDFQIANSTKQEKENPVEAIKQIQKTIELKKSIQNKNNEKKEEQNQIQHQEAKQETKSKYQLGLQVEQISKPQELDQNQEQYHEQIQNQDQNIEDNNQLYAEQLEQLQQPEYIGQQQQDLHN